MYKQSSEQKKKKTKFRAKKKSFRAIYELCEESHECGL